DSDVDGNPLNVRSLTQPTSGVVVLNLDQTITYTPNANFTGTDSFTYIANDGASDSNAATVTIRVATGSNTAPMGNNDSATTNKVTPVTISVLTNDTDANGDVLRVTALAAPINGTVVLNGNGTITYSPNGGF